MTKQQSKLSECASFSEIWKIIADEDLPADLYLIEIERFPGVELTPSFLKTMVEYIDGYFANILSPVERIKFGETVDFSFAHQYSRTLNLGPKEGYRSIEFKSEIIDKETQVVGYLADYKSPEDKVALPEKILIPTQTTNSLLFSLLAQPIIGYFLKRKKVVLLFDEQLIDYINMKGILSYLDLLMKKMEEPRKTSIYVMIVSNRLGKYESFFEDSVQRIGVIADRVFARTNSYRASTNRMSTIVGGINKESPFVLFFGAGVTAEAKIDGESNMPLGDELKRIAIQSVLDPNEQVKQRFELEDLIEKFKDWLVSSDRLIPGETRENVRITLERVLREEFTFVHPSRSKTLNNLRLKQELSQPHIGYQYVKQIINKGYRPIIITTNYDNLLERMLGKETLEYCKAAEFVDKERDLLDYILKKNDTIPVLKIHGSLSKPESIRESVNNTVVLPNEIDTVLTSVFTGIVNASESCVPTFFSGYSFRDSDVVNFFANAQIKNKMMPYIVNPSPSSTVRDFFYSLKPSNSNLLNDDYLRTASINLPFYKFASFLLGKLV